MKTYYVYIATNKRNTVFYTGVTNDIAERMFQHESKINSKSFTSRYNVHKLVYCEEFDSISDAIETEKRIKGWKRQKKVDLIKQRNPQFLDLLDK